MKGRMTKHQQLARTGRAEGLCSGGQPRRMAKGGLVKSGIIDNEKGGSHVTGSAKGGKESHHAVHLSHSGKHNIHVYHHYKK